MKTEHFFTQDEFFNFLQKLQDRGIPYEGYSEDYYDEFGDRYECYVVDYDE